MRISALACSRHCELYRAALPGYRYEFPRDHFNHPEFQTEWWYYTGNFAIRRWPALRLRADILPPGRGPQRRDRRVFGMCGTSGWRTWR